MNYDGKNSLGYGMIGMAFAVAGGNVGGVLAVCSLACVNILWIVAGREERDSPPVYSIPFALAGALLGSALMLAYGMVF